VGSSEEHAEAALEMFWILNIIW